MKSRRGNQKPFTILLTLYSLYSSILIFRSSFVVEGVRYFTLFDDEMISMRYARNLIEGHGLVWNIGGERVEGITNLLWTGIMALIHLLPLPANYLSLPVQVLGLILSLITLVFVKRIIELFSKNQFIVLGGVALTAFYYPLNNWNIVLGTEVSLLTLLITAATYYLLQADLNKKLAMLPFVLLSVALWVRLDAVVPTVVLLVFSWWRLRNKHRSTLFWGTLIIVSSLLLQEGFRFLYYGELLPNTYFLKVTGYPLVLRIARGLYVLKDVLNWLLLSIPLITLIWKKDLRLGLLLILFFSQILYSVYVGGDAWEHFGGSNRYIALSMPFFFISLLVSLSYLYTFVCNYARKKEKVIKGVGFLSLLVIFLSLHLKNDTMLLQALLLRSPQTVGENKQQVLMAQVLDRVSSKDATVGVVWAGIIPYYTERTYFDLLGKSDKTIARQKAHDLGEGQVGLKRFLTFYPGHMKWDTLYIKNKRPDLFIQVYPEEEAKKYLSQDYDQYYDKYGFLLTIRKDTTKVDRTDLEKISFR